MSKRKNAVALRSKPTDQERTAIALATERVQGRPVSPAVLAKMKPAQDDGIPQLQIMPAHSDGPGWRDQLKDTFATSSTDFATLETDRLASALGLHNGNAQEKINAALAAMTAAEPKDEMEAMLASQMVATHALVMDLLQRTKQAKDRQLLETYGGLTNRLLRAYAGHAEVFAKLKRGGEQTVRVEHVHVHAGGQAVVGNVHRRDDRDK